MPYDAVFDELCQHWDRLSLQMELRSLLRWSRRGEKPEITSLLRSDTPERHRFDSPGWRYSIKWRSQPDYRWKSVERENDRDGGMRPFPFKPLRRA